MRLLKKNNKENLQIALCNIRKFLLISWCGNFVKKGKVSAEGLSVLPSKSQILAITKKNYAKVDLVLLDFSTLFQIVSPSSVLRWMSKFLCCKKYILVNFKLLFHWIAQLFNLFVDTKVVLLEVFCKKGFLKHFAKFTGKHFCGNLYFNKVAGLTLF